MKILRVFVRRTNYTPNDDLVAIGEPSLFRPEADEVHISVVFSWDCQDAERLKEAWLQYYPVVRIGGPAYHSDCNGFIAGRYVKRGITFTTRGCNFSCPWCLVPKWEGKFRELSDIIPGNIIQDNNILLSSRIHLNKVFAMLSDQKGIQFKGGIDCRLLRLCDIERLRGLRISELWLALDDTTRVKSFKWACQKLQKAGFTRNQIRCYVLAGYKEPIQKAESRLKLAYECGALPFIQAYQSERASKRMSGEEAREDNLFVRRWSRPAIIKSMGKKDFAKRNFCYGRESERRKG